MSTPPNPPEPDPRDDQDQGIVLKPTLDQSRSGPPPCDNSRFSNYLAPRFVSCLAMRLHPTKQRHPGASGCLVISFDFGLQPAVKIWPANTMPLGFDDDLDWDARYVPRTVL
jgi:hypothetical protein